MKYDITSTATEAATPSTVIAARPGQRRIDRAIIIVVWRRRRSPRTRSATPRAKLGGAGGCIASAGGSRTVDHTARSPPAVTVASASAPDTTSDCAP